MPGRLRLHSSSNKSCSVGCRQMEEELLFIESSGLTGAAQVVAVGSVLQQLLRTNAAGDHQFRLSPAFLVSTTSLLKCKRPTHIKIYHKHLMYAVEVICRLYSSLYTVMLSIHYMCQLLSFYQWYQETSTFRPPSSQMHFESPFIASYPTPDGPSCFDGCSNPT